MSKAKAPKQLYVTAKKQPLYENGVVIGFETPLGFLNAYEPGKTAFEKKRKTQEEWAYGTYLQDFRMEQRGTDFFITGWSWEWSTKTKVQKDEPADPQPQIWDNTPMRGFRIMKSVSRYSTSNKLWRVLDPRGVEFEISTAVLEQLIEDATILKGGEIDAECVWLANKNLIAVG